jgi:DNA-binding response OmpR family regulator
MQPHILVVEDDEIQQSVLKAVLEAGGFDVETVSDGAGAVSKVRDGTYDLVLLDYLLPEIDGLTIARMIRGTMGESARPRLIALTALPDIVIGRELMSGKAFDDVVGKSVDLPEVLAIVTRHLRSAGKAVHGAEALACPSLNG